MNTENMSAAPTAAALEEEHKFNEDGVCEAPDIVIVADMPEHFAAEIRLARAADGWRVGFEYQGPPIGVSQRGVLPCLADAAFGERDAAMAVGVRQLLAALQAKAKAKKAAAAVAKWAKERGIDLHADESSPANQPRTGAEGEECGVRGECRANEPAAEGEPPPAVPTLQVLSIEALAVDGRNPRRSFDDDALHELAESIAANGILQPLVVRARRPLELDKDLALMSGLLPEYIVVAGERRFRAALILAKRGVKVPMPCVVYPALSDRQALIIALTENLQRAQMNPIEEAEGFARLAALGLTQAEIAEIVHKSRPVVANALRLLELPDSVREILRSGKLTTAHGVALARFKAWPKIAARIAELAVEKKMPAGDLEEGLPFEYILHEEKLVEALSFEQEIEEALGVDELELNADGVPVLLAGQPWLLIEKNDDIVEAELWAMDVPAWEAFCAASKAEQQAKSDAAVAAQVREGGAPRAACPVKLRELGYKDFKRVQDLPASVRKALPVGQIEEAEGYCGEATRIVRGEALALATKLERAATIEANREKRAEIDAAWQAAVAAITKIDTLEGGHLAQLLEWACSDYQVGGQADVVTDAAESLKIELPKGVKVISRGVADKLARFTPVQLLQLALTIRARAAWRVAHRDASPLPEDLKLFGATQAPKPVKKKATKAKALQAAA